MHGRLAHASTAESPWEGKVFTTLYEDGVCPHCVPQAAQQTFMNAQSPYVRIWRPLILVLAAALLTLVVTVSDGSLGVVMMPLATVAYVAVVYHAVRYIKEVLRAQRLYLFEDAMWRTHCERANPVSREHGVAGRVLRLDGGLGGWSGLVDGKDRPIRGHSVRLLPPADAFERRGHAAPRFSFESRSLRAEDLQLPTVLRLGDSFASADEVLKRSFAFFYLDYQNHALNDLLRDARDLAASLDDAISILGDDRAREKRRAFALATEVLETLGTISRLHRTSVHRDVPHRLKEALDASFSPQELVALIDALSDDAHPFAVQLREGAYYQRLRQRAAQSSPPTQDDEAPDAASVV